jgi:hypothetical protein
MYIGEHDTKPSDVILSQYISVLRMPKLSKWQQILKKKKQNEENEGIRRLN